MIRIISHKILLPNCIYDGNIYIDEGKIVSVSKEEIECEKVIDLSDYYVSPGFIDIHTHGGGGYSFSGSVDDIINAANFHFSHGTTTICPTISADDFGFMKKSVINVSNAMTDKRAKGTILGAHLEGPYLSDKQAGAQSPDCITDPIEEDYLPLLKEYKNAISRWTYAPERKGADKFEKALKQYGIVASAGHTDAILSDMSRAIDNGCFLVTHLYSCTSTITRDHGFRKLGVVETALLRDELCVELICDGKHLPKELIQLVYKIKGADKIALITDSLMLAGTSEKHGFMQRTEFIIEDGVCKLVDRSAFAGSIATSDVLLNVAVKEANIPIVDAVKMLTQTPARIMNISNKGIIEKGKDADFVVFDDDLGIQKVFANGVEK